MWQNHEYDIVDELVAEDYVLHDPSMQDVEWPGGREGYREMAEMGAGIINGPLEIEQLIPAGEYVVIRWKQTGTHVGEMGDIEPTNEEVTITGIEIDRFEDGKLAETWQEVNVLNTLVQVGVVPEDTFSQDMAARRLSDARELSRFTAALDYFSWGSSAVFLGVTDRRSSDGPPRDLSVRGVSSHPNVFGTFSGERKSPSPAVSRSFVSPNVP